MAEFGNDLELEISARLYTDGLFVYSSELAALLLACRDCGSLHKAAKGLSIGYRRALRLVRMAEEGFGQQLVYKTIGGVGGGGSQLTEFGLMATQRYAQLEWEVAEYAAEKWREIFPGTRAKALFPTRPRGDE